MRISLFLFLALGGLLMLGGSPEVQSKTRNAEKPGQVIKKKDTNVKSPLKTESKGLKSPAQAKSPEKVEISYQGLPAKIVRLGKGRIPRIFLRRSPGKIQTFGFAKPGAESWRGHPFAGSERPQTLSETMGKTPATFTSKGVVSFKRIKKQNSR
jgi:hypothetical protein